VDWNDDGRKDLITGGYDGKVRIYLNTGTDSDPVFSGYTHLQLAGADFDCVDVSFPGVVDWNNDTKKDLFCGEGSGKVNLLINEGTNSDPVFNSAVYIKDGVKDLKVSMRSNPVVADWNRDGKKDLIVGEEFGYIFYYENKGTDAAPVFDGRIQMAAGGQIIDTDSRARPDVADWDGDGVLDILCGQDVWTPSHGPAGVLYFHSLGPLSLSRNWIVANSGGTVDLNLDAGVGNGGRNYLIAGSISGTEPGTLLPGGLVTIPLNRDWFTDYILARLNTSMFSAFWGTLDSTGKATASLNALPVQPGWIGRTIHFAFATAFPWDYVSNPAAVEIVP